MASRTEQSLGGQLVDALDGIAPGNSVSDDIRRNLEDDDVKAIDTEVSKMQNKPATKSDISRGLIGRIPEGGELRTKNGSLTITRGVDSGFLWKDVNRTDADPLGVDETIKKLSKRYKLDILSDPEYFVMFGSHDEGEDAQQAHDQTVRDRVIPEAVQEIRNGKTASGNRANARKSAGGQAKEKKPPKPPKPRNLWSILVMDADGENVEEAVVDEKPFSEFEGGAKGFDAIKGEAFKKYPQRVIRTVNATTGKEYVRRPRKTKATSKSAK